MRRAAEFSAASHTCKRTRSTSRRSRCVAPVRLSSPQLSLLVQRRRAVLTVDQPCSAAAQAEIENTIHKQTKDVEAERDQLIALEGQLNLELQELMQKVCLRRARGFALPSVHT